MIQTNYVLYKQIDLLLLTYINFPDDKKNYVSKGKQRCKLKYDIGH